MSVTGPKRIEILVRDHGKPCALCRDMEGPFEIDHINPTSNGGGDEPDNLQKLCRRCNRDKNNYVANAETGELERPAVVHVSSLAAADPRFRTIHTETLYSVLRVNVGGKRKSRWHDFAVLWDEDHDERVLEVVEALTRAKLIDRVLFIGESVGGVTIHVGSVRDTAAFEGVEREGFLSSCGCDGRDGLCEHGGDEFCIAVHTIDSCVGGPHRVHGVSALSADDLMNIRDRHGLGSKNSGWADFS